MNAQQIQALVDAAQGLLAAQQANNAAVQAQTTTMQGVQATLNGLEQAITNMNQQQQPQAQPQFHEGPFGATTDPGQLIDYKSKAGRWHHKEATTSVFPKDEKFDVEPSKFHTFMRLLAARAKELGFTRPGGIAMVPQNAADPASPRINIFENYGARSYEQVLEWERTYAGAQNRNHQDTLLCFDMIKSTLSTSGMDRVGIWDNQYHIAVNGQRKKAGICFLKVIVRRICQSVGHVSKEAAAILSPVWDLYADNDNQVRLTFDASIPSRGNAYSHPLRLDIRAHTSLWEPLQQALRPLLPKASSAIATANTAKPPPTVTSTKVDWKQQQAQLNKLWQDVVEKKLQNLPTVPIPLALTTNLLQHQIQALQWMVHREKSHDNPLFERRQEKGKTVHFCCLTHASQPNQPRPVSGGILADDMGLGKTLSTLALILAQPPSGRVYTPGQFAPTMITLTDPPKNEDESSAAAAAAATPPMIPTLKDLRTYPVGILRIVATRLLPSRPVATAKKSELVQKLHEALQLKTITPQMLQQAVQAPTTKKAAPSGASSLPLTLVVAPVSVLSNWQDQVDAHVAPHTLRIGLYQGPQRHELLEHPNDYDLWITSYHTLQADFRPVDAKRKAAAASNGTHLFKEKKQKTSRSIFDLKFFRVLLDEGHMIRNPKSGLFRSCAALQAERRWCLTGTPLTNKAEDIASLLAFLGLEPLQDRAVFRRAIAQPLKEGNEQGLTNLRLCMAFAALRRSKEIITLPDKTVELRSVTVDAENQHQKIYDTIYRSARTAFGAALKDQDSKSLSQGNIFEVLLRLRQACCSGTLVPKERILAAEKVLATVEKKGRPLTAQEGQELLERLKGALQKDENHVLGGVPECAICMDEMSAEKAVVLRGCFHVFCKDCLAKTLEYKTICAFCRKPYQQEDMIPYQKAEAASTTTTDSKPSASLTDEWNSMVPSPKMEALLLGLQEMKPDEKGVIFSQFTSFLDQLECFLKEKGWSYVRIDGSKSRKQRMEAISDFNFEDGKRLVLCSLQLGQGINLTRGNHVFLMDTWWNKAIEQQMDRCHRLGQTRACRVVRFVAADSIESRMVELQEAKAALGKGIFENLSPDEKRQARMADLKKLLEL